MMEKEMYLFSNPPLPYTRSKMTVKASFDDCSTWSNSKLIFSGPSAYSCLARLPDGNIGLFFETGGGDEREMVFVAFPPEELFKPGVLITL